MVGESLGEPGRRLLLPGVLCLPGAERRDGQAQLVGQPGEPQETLGETTIQPKLAARLAGWGREMANFQQQAKQRAELEFRSLPGLGLAEAGFVQPEPEKQRVVQKKTFRFYYPALILRSARNAAREVTAF
ncbi:MAG: hypothetical protein BroJett011_16830 [Chloroflexota bacterium]|nr:MAG: hypothetical protein BroJett011_16830 [Chloroflexota bacterium]